MSEDDEKIISIVESGLAKKGWKGVANVARLDDGSITISYTFDDGLKCGVNAGGMMSRRRTTVDLANVAVTKMAEWYVYDKEHPGELR